MSQRRFAVVLLKLFGREHVLAIGHDVAGIAARFVEGIDHQCPLDLDRLALFIGIEHQPPAEAARGGESLRQHGVFPHGDDFQRALQRAVLAFHPRNGLAQIEVRAAGAQQHECRGKQKQVPDRCHACIPANRVSEVFFPSVDSLSRASH
jgi:hypothetical protein